jgi:hypothetical protein
MTLCVLDWQEGGQSLLDGQARPDSGALDFLMGLYREMAYYSNACPIQGFLGRKLSVENYFPKWK